MFLTDHEGKTLISSDNAIEGDTLALRKRKKNFL